MPKKADPLFVIFVHTALWPQSRSQFFISFSPVKQSRHSPVLRGAKFYKRKLFQFIVHSYFEIGSTYLNLLRWRQAQTKTFREWLTSFFDGGLPSMRTTFALSLEPKLFWDVRESKLQLICLPKIISGIANDKNILRKKFCPQTS